MALGLRAPDVLSWHAWRRYRERVPGAASASYEEACGVLLTAQRRRWIAMGVSKVFVPADRLVLICADGVVVTVLTWELFAIRYRGASGRPRAWRGRARPEAETLA